MVFTTEGLLEVARRSNHLSYQAMSSRANFVQLLQLYMYISIYTRFIVLFDLKCII